MFGSFADGTYNEKSDIDLAVLYDGKSDISEHLADSIDIEKIFESTKIDYIDLQQVSLLFRFKILKNGLKIYVKDEDKMYGYIYLTKRNYIEISYSRKKYEQYVLEHGSLEDEENEKKNLK